MRITGRITPTSSVLVLLILAMTAHTAVAATTWVERVGGEAASESLDAGCQASDGGYILVGGGPSDADGYEESWIVKLSTSGAVAWQKSVGSLPQVSDFLEAVCQTADGGYLAVGRNIDSHTGDDVCSGWLVKLNVSGQVLWQKMYGAKGREAFYSVCPLADGGALVAGDTRPVDGSQPDGWVVRVDANGNVLWAKTYGGDEPDAISRIVPARDGGFLLWGTSRSFSSDTQFWLSHIDAAGNLGWSKCYKAPLAGYLGSEGIAQVASASADSEGIAQSSDGTIVVTGRLARYPNDEGVRVFGLDEAGAPRWQLSADTPDGDSLADVAATPDGRFVVVGGRSTQSGLVRGTGWVLRLDSTGNTLWWRQFEGTEQILTRGAFVLANDDGTCLLGGEAYVTGGAIDAFLARLDSTGHTTGADCSLITDSPISLLPTSLTVIDVTPTQTPVGSTVAAPAGLVTPTTASQTVLCKGVGPEITKIRSRTSKPGSQATIRGNGFSTTAKKNTVYFGTKKATVGKAKTTMLRVTIPKRAKGTVNVKVVVDGLASNEMPFTVK